MDGLQIVSTTQCGMIVCSDVRAQESSLQMVNIHMCYFY